MIYGVPKLIFKYLSVYCENITLLQYFKRPVSKWFEGHTMINVNQ